MKFLLICVIYSTFAFLSTCANPAAADVLRTIDLVNLRTTIYEETGKIYIQSLDKDTGKLFGPTQIYDGLLRKNVEENIQEPITLDHITETAAFITPPMYSYAVQMDLKVQTDDQKNVQRLDSKIEDQSKLLNDLQKRLEVLINRDYYGKTTPNDWVNYEGVGIKTVIDISHLNLTEIPHVLISLNGNGSHWRTTGGSSIYLLSNTQFEVYIRYSDGVTATVADARAKGWYVSYTVVSKDIVL